MEEDWTQAKPDISKGASVRQHFSKITMYTLLCFALAGLIAGFAIGGFARHLMGV